MSREAMKLALDMLNEIADDVYCDQKLEGVITALRQALETDLARVGEVGVWGEWQGLTDDEVSEIIDREIGFNSCWGPEEAFARAIEQALKEKNYG